MVYKYYYVNKSYDFGFIRSLHGGSKRVRESDTLLPEYMTTGFISYKAILHYTDLPHSSNYWDLEYLLIVFNSPSIINEKFEALAELLEHIRKEKVSNEYDKHSFLEIHFYYSLFIWMISNLGKSSVKFK